MFYSDDPVRDAERYMAQAEDELALRPVCDCCGYHIQEEFALHYGDIWLCDSCVEDNRDYIEVED